MKLKIQFVILFFIRNLTFYCKVNRIPIDRNVFLQIKDVNTKR